MGLSHILLKMHSTSRRVLHAYHREMKREGAEKKKEKTIQFR